MADTPALPRRYFTPEFLFDLDRRYHPRYWPAFHACWPSLEFAVFTYRSLQSR